jgi:hypothetical protein
MLQGAENRGSVSLPVCAFDHIYIYVCVCVCVHGEQVWVDQPAVVFGLDGESQSMFYHWCVIDSLID